MTKAIESGMAKLRIEEAATRKQVRQRIVVVGVLCFRYVELTVFVPFPF